MVEYKKTYHDTEFINKLEKGNIFVNGYTYVKRWVKKFCYKYNNILLLAENNKLYENCKKLDNVEVNTYISFCTKYIKNTESEIDFVANMYNPPVLQEKYNVIVIMDLHNITSYYYKLIIHIIKHNQSAKICIFGNENEIVNTHLSADIMYFQNYEKLFINKYQWNKMETNENPFSKLDINYYKIDEFINILPEITKIPENVIMTNSNITKITCITNIINNLVDKKIPIYIPSGNDTMFNIEITNNKLVYCNFYQIQKFYRKTVVIFINTGRPLNKINENLKYRAMLSASERIIFVNFHHDYFANPDYSVGSLTTFTNPIVLFNALSYIDFEEINPKEQILATPKNIKVLFNENIVNQFNIINNKKTKILLEKVNDITGVLIPAYYEFTKTNNLYMLTYLRRQNVDIKVPESLQEILNKINNGSHIEINNENLIKIYLIYDYVRNGYKHKMYQINFYDWLDKQDLELSCNRLNNLIKNNTVIEASYKHKFSDFTLYGRVDIVNNNNVIETKVTKELHIEDFLQIASYAFLIEKEHELKINKQITDLKQKRSSKNQKKKIKILENELINKKNTYYLFNIRTNQLFKLKWNLPDLEKLVNILIDAKLKYCPPLY